jgi:hypothetical protein
MSADYIRITVHHAETPICCQVQRVVPLYSRVAGVSACWTADR